MIKYKVSDVAKDFAVTSKDIIALLNTAVSEPKKTSSSLNEEELSILFELMTKKHEVKSFDEYFATGAEAREKAAKERQDEKERKLADQMAVLEQLKAAQRAEEEAKKA